MSSSTYITLFISKFDILKSDANKSQLYEFKKFTHCRAHKRYDDIHWRMNSGQWWESTHYLWHIRSVWMMQWWAHWVGGEVSLGASRHHCRDRHWVWGVQWRGVGVVMTVSGCGECSGPGGDPQRVSSGVCGGDDCEFRQWVWGVVIHYYIRIIIQWLAIEAKEPVLCGSPNVHLHNAWRTCFKEWKVSNCICTLTLAPKAETTPSLLKFSSLQ